MINSEQRLSEQFENPANRILLAQQRRVDEQNREPEQPPTPLREQLTAFAVRQDSFGQEAQRAPHAGA